MGFRLLIIENGYEKNKIQKFNKQKTDIWTTILTEMTIQAFLLYFYSFFFFCRNSPLHHPQREWSAHRPIFLWFLSCFRLKYGKQWLQHKHINTIDQLITHKMEENFLSKSPFLTLNLKIFCWKKKHKMEWIWRRKNISLFQRIGKKHDFFFKSLTPHNRTLFLVPRSDLWTHNMEEKKFLRAREKEYKSE